MPQLSKRLLAAVLLLGSALASGYVLNQQNKVVRASDLLVGIQPASRKSSRSLDQTAQQGRLQAKAGVDMADPTLGIFGRGEYLNAVNSFDEVSENPLEADLKVLQLAQSLTPAEAIQLKDIVLNNHETMSRRWIAVYALGLRADDFAEELEDVVLQGAVSADPNLATEDQRDEVNLRQQALLRVEALIHLDGLAPQGFYHKVAEFDANPLVRQLAETGKAAQSAETTNLRREFENQLSQPHFQND